MMNLRRVAACSLHLWKRQIATPPLTRTALFSTGDGDSEKAKLFPKLSCLTADYLDRISMEQGVSLTESDLADWAKRLSGDGNHERALEIYQWMEKKNMAFSPSDIAHFVELRLQTRTLAAAQAYFCMLDPGFRSIDLDLAVKNWGSPPLSRECLSQHIENMRHSLVFLWIEPNDLHRDGNLGNTGSGFFVNRNTIVTNCHVVVNRNIIGFDNSYEPMNKKVSIYLHNGILVMGNISSYDVNRDLALIHVTDDAMKDVDISCAKLGNDLPVKRGQLVGALGAPLSMRNCFTHGVLSFVNRTLTEDPARLMWLQVDMKIESGSSGGPLFNTDGIVIGVVTKSRDAAHPSTPPYITLAIPANDVAEFLRFSSIS